MKKMLMIIVMFALLIVPVYAKEKETSNLLAPNAKSAMLIEASTGEILYQFNPHEKLAPASMTNVMDTELLQN